MRYFTVPDYRQPMRRRFVYLTAERIEPLREQKCGVHCGFFNA